MAWKHWASRRSRVVSRLALLATLALSACAHPQLPAFERTLAAQDSATAALGQWCAARRLADPPQIRAERLAEASPPPPDVRALLQASPDEPLAMRRVRLRCGPVVMSEAWNWYRPARLTPQMNATLDSSDTPFGRVAAPLGFRRERLSSQRGRAEGCPVGTVLSHRALLRLPDGQPLALVTECYTRATLDQGAGTG
jgi:chorismate-pyruvate lyase